MLDDHRLSVISTAKRRKQRLGQVGTLTDTNQLPSTGTLPVDTVARLPCLIL